jgi:hypothetical protein
MASAPNEPLKRDVIGTLALRQCMANANAPKLHSSLLLFVWQGTIDMEQFMAIVEAAEAERAGECDASFLRHMTHVHPDQQERSWLV